jgi:hypothetical protein
LITPSAKLLLDAGSSKKANKRSSSPLPSLRKSKIHSIQKKNAKWVRRAVEATVKYYEGQDRESDAVEYQRRGQEFLSKSND